MFSLTIVKSLPAKQNIAYTNVSTNDTYNTCHGTKLFSFFNFAKKIKENNENRNKKS